MSKWSNNQPYIKNKNMAVLMGAIFLTLGAACLHDAYEGRGDSQPFWGKFLPG